MQHPTWEPDGTFAGFAPSDEYVEKALARGELVRSEDDYLVVVPQPIRELTPEEKRRLVLARERAKK